jgi:transposase
VAIPFDRLIQQIRYKAQLVGIKVTTEEEGYTSKCSALDLETIGKHEDHAYAGKRVKRGLFRTSLGILINADVNGALNILRKVIGDTFLKPFVEKVKLYKVARLIPSSGYLCYPFKVCF